jgi:Flp pilus assembly protein TadG
MRPLSASCRQLLSARASAAKQAARAILRRGRSGKGLSAPLALAASFARARRGSVAVEFALLALPFSLLVFAILETSVSYVAQQTMMNATDDIARQLRTGVLKSSDVAGDKLQQMICARIQILVATGCPDLLVDLENYTTFSQVPTSIPYTSTGDIDTSGFKVDPGGSTSINQLRVFYRWPVMTDIMRASMSNLPGGKTLLFATDTWQNEPY